MSQQKTAKELREALSAPFLSADIEWRVSATTGDKTRGLAVPYVTNRAIQNRLDDTVGVDGWRNEFVPWKDNKAQLCGISIRFPDGWLTKWDGADDSDVEPVKGGLSDSMKRAAVEWGIGRYLYGMTQVWIGIEQRGKSFVIPDSQRAILDRTHEEWIARLRQKKGDSGNTQKPQTQDQPAPQAAPQPPQAQPAPQLQAAPQQGQPAPQAVRAQPAGGTVVPNGAYLITGAVSKKTLSGKSRLHLQLQDSAGQAFQAFLGCDPDPRLVPGTLLTDATFSTKNSQGVTFYVMETYQIAATGFNRAA